MHAAWAKAAAVGKEKAGGRGQADGGRLLHIGGGGSASAFLSTRRCLLKSSRHEQRLRLRQVAVVESPGHFGATDRRPMWTCFTAQLETWPARIFLARLGTISTLATLSCRFCSKTDSPCRLGLSVQASLPLRNCAISSREDCAGEGNGGSGGTVGRRPLEGCTRDVPAATYHVAQIWHGTMAQGRP